MATAEHTETDTAVLEELAYVGPRTAERLVAAGIAASDVREKRVSYRGLVDADVNPGVAAKLRREHSLHWTLDEQGADLGRRSELVRGLQDEERDWVASAMETEDGEEEPSTGDASEWEHGGNTDDTDPTATDADDADDDLAAEAAWRERANGSH